MFNIGPWELLLILVIVLIVFGPGRLPEVARALGKAVNEFRRASTGVQRMWEEAIREAPAPQSAEQDAAARGGQAEDQQRSPGVPEA